MTYKSIHAKPQNLTTNDLDNQDTIVLVKMGRRTMMYRGERCRNLIRANFTVSIAIMRAAINSKKIK